MPANRVRKFFPIDPDSLLAHSSMSEGIFEPQSRKDTKMMKVFEPLPPETEVCAKIVVDAAYKVHSGLGPGLLESVYEICLAHELRKRGLTLETQVAIPILYDGIRLEAGLRIDILVERQLLIEIKAVEEMKRVFRAQILTYLKLTGTRLGFLINFNVPLIKNGLERIIL
jgi:GxxExxY protein